MRRERERQREIANERRNEGGEAAGRIGSSAEVSLETEPRLGIRESREIILNKTSLGREFLFQNP